MRRKLRKILLVLTMFFCGLITVGYSGETESEEKIDFYDLLSGINGVNSEISDEPWVAAYREYLLEHDCTFTMIPWEGAKELETNQVSVWDMDDDGIPELIPRYGTEAFDRTGSEVLTYSDGKVVSCGKLDSALYAPPEGCELLGAHTWEMEYFWKTCTKKGTEVTTEVVANSVDPDIRNYAVNLEYTELEVYELTADMLDFESGESMSKQQVSLFWKRAAGMYYHASGAGGWGEELEIHEDGSFSGSFLDDDMGSTGKGYSATEYQSDYTGAFTDVQRVSELEYLARVRIQSYEKEPGTSEIIDQTLHSYTESAGLQDGSVVRIFLTGTAWDAIPEGMQDWIRMPFSGKKFDPLPFHAIYDTGTGRGFWGEEREADQEFYQEDFSVSYGDHTVECDSSWFDSSSDLYDKNMAELAGLLSWASEDTFDNLQYLLKEIGIYSEDVYHDVFEISEDSSAEYTIANQVMMIHSVPSNILFVTAGGAEDDSESIRKIAEAEETDFFDYTANSCAAGYAEKILAGIEEYLEQHSDMADRPTFLIITGHGLGGAAANLTGAALDLTIGEDTSLFPDLDQAQIYVYTFGAMDSLKSDNSGTYPVVSGFENIHNICNFYDSINLSAGLSSTAGDSFNVEENYGIGRFGQEHGLAVNYSGAFRNSLDEALIAENHQMKNYVQAAAEAKVQENCRMTRITVRCPGDLQVNRDGESVAEISENEINAAKLIENPEIAMVTLGEDTYIGIFDDPDDYSMNVTAAEDGNLAVQTVSLNEAGESCGIAAYEEKNIEAGSEYTVSLPEVNDSADRSSGEGENSLVVTKVKAKGLAGIFGTVKKQNSTALLVTVLIILNSVLILILMLLLIKVMRKRG
ncbi:MAG: hypothetical protein Q4B03_00420 [Lachnospiraceae bacterium]|nr:hypothetical protein [Lachnospiraceae bacterium]